VIAEAIAIGNETEFGLTARPAQGREIAVGIADALTETKQITFDRS
jgi:hypothetical protein